MTARVPCKPDVQIQRRELKNWVVVNSRAWRLSASGKLDVCTSYPLEHWPLTSRRRDEGGSLFDFRWTERIDLVRLQ